MTTMETRIMNKYNRKTCIIILMIIMVDGRVRKVRIVRICRWLREGVSTRAYLLDFRIIVVMLMISNSIDRNHCRNSIVKINIRSRCLIWVKAVMVIEWMCILIMIVQPNGKYRILTIYNNNSKTHSDLMCSNNKCKSTYSYIHILILSIYKYKLTLIILLIQIQNNNIY
jgi:hypothetical protein